MEYPRKPKGFLPFERLVDRTCVETGPGSSIKDMLGKVGMVSYKRPVPIGTKEQPEGEMIGVGAMELLSKWTAGELRLNGGEADLGFLFFYELLVGTIAFKVLRSDATHSLACILLRLLPEEDTKESMLLSILRVLAENPELARKAPRYEDEQRFFAKMFKGSDHFSGFLAKVKQFMDENKANIKWPAVYSGHSHHWLMAGPPGQNHPLESKCPVSIEFLPERLFCDRTWLSVQIPNLTCSKRDLSPQNVPNAMKINLNITADQVTAYATAPLGLGAFVTQCSGEDAGMQPVSASIPFNVDKHPCASSHVATSMVKRLTEDVKYFAEKTNAQTSSRLVAFLDRDLQKIVANPQAGEQKQAVQLVTKLTAAINQQMQGDRKYVDAATDHLLSLANCTNPGTTKEKNTYTYLLGQQSGEECTITFELLVGMLLCSTGDEDLIQLNPCLSPAQAKSLQDMTATIMLAVNRISLGIRCRDLAQSVMSVLQNLESMVSRTGPVHVGKELLLKSSTLASALSTERQCIYKEEAGGYYYEPRFLVFEFVHNIMLRKQQHDLVLKFMGSVAAGKSLCHQMIMGAGKTTVVGPLLALLLGDGSRIVLQVMPAPLLEFSRGVMREKFSAVIRKAVYTFKFDRTTEVSISLLKKLLIAQKTRAVVMSTPTSVKSFVIKYVELLHILDFESVRDHNIKRQQWSLASFFGLKRPPPQRDYTPQDLQAMREECQTAVNILQLFQKGALLLDEVDLILHPLKSELNWPLGDKTPLDLTMNRSGPGLRWQIPFVLLDAVLYCSTGRTTIQLIDSRDALKVLAEIKSVIDVSARQYVFAALR